MTDEMWETYKVDRLTTERYKTKKQIGDRGLYAKVLKRHLSFGSVLALELFLEREIELMERDFDVLPDINILPTLVSKRSQSNPSNP